MDPAALRTYDERSLSGKILHIDREGNGLPGHPFCPGERTSTSSARSSTRRASATRSASSCARGRARSSATWAGSATRRSTFARRPQLRLALLRGPGRMTPDYKELAECAGALRRRATPPDAPGLRLQPRRRRAAARSSPGRSYTGTRYPRSGAARWFFGDYVQRWLRASDIVGRAGHERADVRAEGFDGVDLELTPEGDLAYMRISTPTGTSRPAASSASSTATRHRPRSPTPTPASGAAPLEVELQRRRVDRPRRRRGHLRVGLRRRHADASGAHVDARLRRTRRLHGEADRARRARAPERGHRARSRVDVTPPVATIEAPGRRIAVPPRHAGAAAGVGASTRRTGR